MKKLKTIFWTFTFILLAAFVTAGPELSVENLRVSDLNPAVEGTTANLKFDLINSGDATATDFRYSISITGETARTRIMPYIAAGATMPQTVAVSISSNGTINATIMADCENKYTETNESNNIKTIQIEIQDPVKGMTMSNAQTTINPTESEAELRFVAEHVGNVDIDAVTFSVSDLKSGNDTISASNVQITPNPTQLLVGGIKNIAVKVTMPQDYEGTYTGTITGNYGSGNTTSTITINVRNPTPQVEATGDISMSGTWGDSASDSITLTNKGGAPEKLDLTATLSGFDVKLSESSITLKGGESKTITLSTTIPNDADATENKGTLKVKGVVTDLSVPITVDVTGGKLKIDEVEISIDESSYKTISSSGKDIEPLSELKFKVTVKNQFSSSKDEIQDIEVNLVIDGKDWDEDEDENLGDLDGKDDGEVEFTGIKVPSDVEDKDKYNITITAEGEDDDGRKHSATWTSTLTIEQEKDDLRITELSVGSDELAPGGETRLKVEVTNAGSDDQKEAKIKVTSTELGISESYTERIDQAGDSDDEITKYIDVKIPEIALVGKEYRIIATVYGDDGDELDEKSITITVKGTATPSNDLADNSAAGKTPTQSNVQSGITTSGGAAIAQKIDRMEGSFRDSGAYTAILIVGVLAVIGGGAFLVWKFW